MYHFVVPKKIKKAKKKRDFTPVIYVFIILLSFALAGIISFQLYLASLSPINNLENFKPNVVTQIYSDDGEVIKTFAAYTFKKVDLEDIPEALIQAIISTEDKNFYKHHGYDLTGLARSIVANVMAGKVIQGASTITHQLSRILFLSNEKTFNRKIKEFLIAARIEKSISKDKILEMYLNDVYLGAGAYGVESAAQIYFNKHVNQLSLGEIALIAGLPQAPSVYSPYNNMKLAIKRRNQVLKRMYKMRFIDKEAYQIAKEEKVKLNPMPQIYTLNKAPYFCDYVMRELVKLGFDEDEISQGGYKITTTLNYKAQQATNEAILKNMKAWGLTSPKHQAAVFSYDVNTGKILAYAGGKNYAETQYDRVTQAIRPPGSAFKPFIYAAALEKGLTPNDMIEDMPFKIGSWAPRNYGNKYRGTIPLYSALMVSSNVCAVRLIKYVGIRPVIQMARVLGLSTPLEYDYTIALGSNGVKLFELTRAYSAFANGGFRVEPYAIEKIETSRGTVIYTAQKTRPVKVLNIDTASQMTAMLKTVIVNGTGKAANIGKPAAAKTGTTDDYKDACFVGYTPDVVTGVWVGNDDNTKMNGLTGGTVPALIWKDIMTVATVPFGNADFRYEPYDLKSFKGSGVKIISVSEIQKTPEKEEETIDEFSLTEMDNVEDTKKNIFNLGGKKDEQKPVSVTPPVQPQVVPQQSSVIPATEAPRPPVAAPVPSMAE